MKKSELRNIIRELIKENLGQEYPLDELTFDIVKQFFPKEREIAFPNTDDTSRLVSNERDLEDWKSETKNKFGNVRIFFNPNAVWYDQVKIKDEKFNKAKDSFRKGKQAFLDKEN